MKKQILTLTAIAAILTSCDKEEMIDVDAFELPQTIVEYNKSNTSSKTTSSELVIENHGAARTEVITTNEGDDVTVYFGKLVEETTAEHPTIIGSVAYQLIDFKDTTQNPDLIGATINYADGSQEVVEPTSSFELN